jgi:hypothetical protein
MCRNNNGNMLIIYGFWLGTLGWYIWWLFDGSHKIDLGFEICSFSLSWQNNISVKLIKLISCFYEFCHLRIECNCDPSLFFKIKLDGFNYGKGQDF